MCNLDLKSKKDEMRDSRDICEILDEITDLFPEDVKRSGKPREYFEEKMLERFRWGHLEDDQYVLVWSMVKAILDRTYPS